MSDDYLWDPTSPPDPEVERLERVLRPYRYEREAPVLAARRRRWPAFAAAALLALALAVGLRSHEAESPSPSPGGAPTTSASWACTRESGEACAPLAPPGAEETTAADRVAVGGWIETGAGERVHLEVADIGRLTLGEHARLGLLATGTDGHRVRLERGAIHAVVDAPPRLFVVETPAVEAVDLGCEYTLEVDAEGSGRLEVAKGWVALERDGRSAVVPYDAACAIRSSGPGTPAFRDAHATLHEAPARLDFGEPRAGDLDAVLAVSRKRDTLTLFHLLSRFEGAERERIHDRMAQLVQPPRDVTRAGTLALDEAMLAVWLDELRWEAWDPPPGSAK